MSLSLADLIETKPASVTITPSLPADIFYGTRGRRNAPIMVVGEAWGQNEKDQQKPFVGASGKELEAMLREAGIDPADCFFTNLIPDKPMGNDMRAFLFDIKHKGDDLLGDGIKPQPRLADGLRRLDAQIEAVRPQLIIATGNWPLWYLTRKANAKTSKGYRLPTGIDTWRGSQLFLCPSPFRAYSAVPVLPIYHPAAILRMYAWRKITVQDLSRASDFAYDRMPSWRDTGADDRFNVIRPSAKELSTHINAWIKEPHIPIVCDVETKKYRLHIVGLTRDGKTNIAIPFFAITPDGFRPLYTPLEFKEIYLLLIKLFSAPGMKFVGQNWSYDIQYITKFFFTTPELYWDTIIGQHVAFPRLKKSLDYQASMYCKHYVYWKDDLKESTDSMDWEAACNYNCEDLWRTHEIWKVQEELLPALGKLQQFRERMEVFPCCVDMMNDGVLVNRALKDRQRVQLLQLSMEISNWLESIMPDRLKPDAKTPWFGSPKNLKYILYDRLGLRPVINRQTGTATTDKEALIELSERYPQWAGFLSAILLLRSVRVVAGNILSAPLESDGRIRTSYNITATITYRLSSSTNVWDGGGNLQNILRDREDMDLLEQDLT
jgi:uracil-DNA glycosylase